MSVWENVCMRECVYERMGECVYECMSVWEYGCMSVWENGCLYMQLPLGLLTCSVRAMAWKVSLTPCLCRTERY